MKCVEKLNSLWFLYKDEILPSQETYEKPMGNQLFDSITKFILYSSLPLNSPSKKVNKKDSYTNGSEHIITRISPRETHVKSS